MNLSLHTFRIDDSCFILYIPTSRPSPFLRIGDSEKLTPYYRRHISMVLLSELIPVDYQKEFEHLKDGNLYGNEFISLPNLIYHFKQQLQKREESHFDLHTIPVKTGRILPHNLENSRKVQVLFYKSKNIKFQIGSEDVFDLRNELKKPFSAKDGDEALEALRNFIEVLSRDPGKTNGEELLQGVFTPEDFKNLNEKLGGHLNQHDIMPESDQLFLITPDEKKIALKDEILEISSFSQLFNSMYLEINTEILRVGKLFSFRIERDSRPIVESIVKLSTASVISREERYGYTFIPDNSSPETSDSINLIRQFRYHQFLQQFLATGSQ